MLQPAYVFTISNFGYKYDIKVVLQIRSLQPRILPLGKPLEKCRNGPG
jgi:hypothetical protein